MIQHDPQDVAAALQGVESGTYRSRREASRATGIPESTLRFHANGGGRAARKTMGGWPTNGPTLRPDGLPSAPDMPVEIPVIHRDYTRLEKLNVYPLGDVHKGSPYHAGETWREWIDYLANTPGVSLLNTGDNFNAALKNSKSESYDEVLTVGQAIKEFRNEIRPLAEQGKMDLLMPGNHEDRIYRAVGFDPNEIIAEDLEIPYAAAAVVLVYHVGEQEYEFFVRHGTGNYPGKVGTQLNQLQEGIKVVATADVHVSGHTHSQAVGTSDVFVRDGDVMRRRRLTFMSSGSFLNYEKYAAVRGYSPSRIGAPRIYLDGTRKDLHVSV